MKLRKIICCFFFLVSLSFSSKGQDPIFSQFFSAPTYLNPAFAGASDCSQMVFNYRNLPSPQFGTFSTFNFSADTRIPRIGGGIGLLVTSDHQGGLIMQNQISAIYSHKVKISDDFFVNLGIQGGYFRNELHWDKLVFYDQINPSTGEVFPQNESPPAQTWIDGIDFASGILFYSERIYGGVAIHHLNTPERGFFATIGWPRKYTAHLGLHLPLKHSGFGLNKTEDLFISPNLVYQQQGPHKRINYGMYAGFSSFVAGLWFRQNLTLPSTLIFMVGLQLEKYKIGYSYDHSLSGYSGVLSGAHEISVSFNFNCGQKNKRRHILNCPIF
jgi:type IX secretion system PorP/SprF family membrane protein